MSQTTKLPTVYINMLGEFSITIDNQTINDQNNQSKKPWSLLEYLITFRNREVSPSELIELIWGDEDSSNPNGALKTLMFRSRKLLTPLGFPPQNLLVQRRGSYAWSQEVTTIADIDLFEALTTKAVNSHDTASEQLDSCLKALDLYKGDFLPKSDWETWVVPISTYYHSLYQKIAHHAIDLLLETENYSKIVDLCQKATQIDPYDENLHFHLIQALFKSGQQHAALEHYNHTVDMLYSEFAITPSEKLKSLYKVIRDTEHGITTDLSIIQDSFLEEGMQGGAFFCEYTVFKDIYQLESRAIERTGDSIYLCVLTLGDINGTLLQQPFLNKGMDALGDAIRSSLRRGDTYSRFSVSQYMILLPTSTYENGELVLKRIIQNFHKLYTRKNMTVNYSLQAIIPRNQIIS